MKTVYTVTRRDFEHHTTNIASAAFISVHATKSSANKAARAHCKSQIREAGGSTKEHGIEEYGGDLFSGVVKTWFEDRYGGARDRIVVEVKVQELRDDGTNGGFDDSDADSDGLDGVDDHPSTNDAFAGGTTKEQLDRERREAERVRDEIFKN